MKNIRPESMLHSVKVNMLSRVVTLLGEDGEEITIENNSAEEFTNMCNFINESLPDDRIEYTY